MAHEYLDWDVQGFEAGRDKLAEAIDSGRIAGAKYATVSVSGSGGSSTIVPGARFEWEADPADVPGELTLDDYLADELVEWARSLVLEHASRLEPSKYRVMLRGGGGESTVTSWTVHVQPPALDDVGQLQLGPDGGSLEEIDATLAAPALSAAMRATNHAMDVQSRVTEHAAAAYAPVLQLLRDVVRDLSTQLRDRDVRIESLRDANAQNVHRLILARAATAEANARAENTEGGGWAGRLATVAERAIEVAADDQLGPLKSLAANPRLRAWMATEEGQAMLSNTSALDNLLDMLGAPKATT